MALIAEIKKASPSKGIICPDFDPEAIARSYEQAGASCLSVLTDETYFQGSLDYLRRVREVVQLPLLRKDFMIDPRQIEQAIAYGADAILLIVAMLEQQTLRQLHDLATQAGLTALVEVHDEEELAGHRPGAKLVGINNRNLKDFTVNLSTTHQLAARWGLGQTEGCAAGCRKWSFFSSGCAPSAPRWGSSHPRGRIPDARSICHPSQGRGIVGIIFVVSFAFSP